MVRDRQGRGIVSGVLVVTAERVATGRPWETARETVRAVEAKLIQIVVIAHLVAQTSKD